MCGFVTLITQNRKFSQDILVAMRDRLIHRGPDDCGHAMEDTGKALLGMGHRRLAIIDLSEAGRQPMQDSSGRYLISFNGEIYNYLELREELRQLGYHFYTDTDTEVLLNAYAEWGQECLHKLNGMFAFTLWDRQDKKLFVARDRYGEKPLYYAPLPAGGIAFSSEIKAFFAHPDIHPVIHEEVVADFLNGITSYTNEDVFFKNIYRFKPAHFMVIDAAGNILDKQLYWQGAYKRPFSLTPLKILTGSCRKKLQNAVKIRLRSDVRVGSSLSGGLDSSTITGMIQELADKGEADLGKAYAVRFDNNPEISEGDFIDQMAQHKPIRLENITPKPEEFIEESKRLHWHQEQPFLSISMYLEWCLAKKVRQDGTIVLLDGQGADEFLAGYQFYFKYYQVQEVLYHRYIRLILNTVLFNRRLKKAYKNYNKSKNRINKSIAYQVKDIVLRIKKIHQDYKRGTRYVTAQFPLQNCPQKDVMRTAMLNGIVSNMLANNLHSADCNGMAHSIETRFPYLDYTLTDWFFRLPTKALIHRGWMKYILRTAVKGIIPEAIRWRVDKIGYAGPQEAWLRNELKTWAYENLTNGPVTKLAAYDRDQVKKDWDRHQSGKEDLSWNIWRWISLNEWLKLHEDNIWKAGLPS